MTDYAPGTPCWVELATTDADSAAAFYEGLFGWEAPEGDPQYGGYRTFLRAGRSVGGLNPMGQGPMWITYVATADAGATAEAARSNGGAVVVEPMDVADLGRMTLFTDSEGALLGAWEPGTMPGAELVNQPGSLAWNDLNTHSTERAKAFYSDVFPWAGVDQDMGGGAPYLVWELSGRPIGGCVQVPEQAPVQWVTWFAVADRDATVARAAELGGTVLEPKLDIPGVGLLGVLRDPEGAFFGVMQGEQPDE